MSTKPLPSESTFGKISAIAGGGKLANGAQISVLGVLLWIGWQGNAIYDGIMGEAERTREEIATLGRRLDTMEDTIATLADNAKRIEAVEAESVRAREALARLQLETAAALACARDKRRCP